MLAEANLAAIWSNSQALGHHRLIYVHTVSVLESDMIRRALGGGAIAITGVRLTADDAMVREQLGRREIGSTMDLYLERSGGAARYLEETAGDAVHRVATDGRPFAEIAAESVRLTGWVDGIAR